CLVGVGPGARRDPSAQRILGTEGVGLAGDVFDGEVVDAVVSPRLGKGSSYRSYLDGKEISVPAWLYERVRRWHHLSFLRSRETLRFVKEMRDQCPDPRALSALLHLVEDDLGFDLHRAVEGTKVKLSREGVVNLRFVDDPVHIDVPVSREDFERWIAGDLELLRGCIDRLFAHTGVKPAEVDRVFLTGGTSMVPAVRQIFVERFVEAFKAGGGEIKAQETYDIASDDYAAPLKKIGASGAKLIITPAPYHIAGAMMAQAKKLTPSIKFLGSDSWDTKELTKAAGAGAPGHFFVTHFALDDADPLVAEFAKAFQQKYSRPPGAIAALTYDAVNLIVEAFARARSNFKGPLTSAIGKTKDFQGVTGLISFTDSGEFLKGGIIKETLAEGSKFKMRVMPLAKPVVDPKQQGKGH
ncbi:MAG: ABC transporter substrate-binding protein, partial [Proteobacteria bacterium]|nr:ABC transporter substrate-binding protein [Pseudomonadota bacterium]